MSTFWNDMFAKPATTGSTSPAPASKSPSEEVSKKDELIAQLTERINVLKEELNQAATENEAAKSKILKLESQAELIKAEAERWKKEAFDAVQHQQPVVEQVKNAEEVTLQKQISELQMENQALKSKLSGASLLREELTAKVASLQKQVQESEQKRLNETRIRAEDRDRLLADLEAARAELQKAKHLHREGMMLTPVSELQLVRPAGAPTTSGGSGRPASPPGGGRPASPPLSSPQGDKGAITRSAENVQQSVTVLNVVRDARAISTSGTRDQSSGSAADSSSSSQYNTTPGAPKLNVVAISNAPPPASQAPSSPTGAAALSNAARDGRSPSSSGSSGGTTRDNRTVSAARSAELIALSTFTPGRPLPLEFRAAILSEGHHSYLRVMNVESGKVRTDTQPDAWEFHFLQDNVTTIRNVRNKKYLCAEKILVHLHLTVNRTEIGSWEKWRFVYADNEPGKFFLLSSHGTYLHMDRPGQKARIDAKELPNYALSLAPV